MNQSSNRGTYGVLSSAGNDAASERAPVQRSVCRLFPQPWFSPSFALGVHPSAWWRGPLACRCNRSRRALFGNRTHALDKNDALVAALANGIRQVVILGAGFDCRAFRIPELRAARIFEVDHPQTFATKRAQLAQFIEREPANLTFVQIDFNRQSLEEVCARRASIHRSAVYFSGKV